MKRIIALMLAIWLVLGGGLAEEVDLFSTPAPKTQATPDAAPRLSDSPLLEAPPIQLNCAAALLVEAESGQIIFEMNADSPRPVASVTKVMTILLTLEALDQGRIALDQTVTVSAKAAGMGGSQVLLDVNETQTVEVLLKSTIVGSANDACVALAELMYGSQELCVTKMNARAKELGMTNTVFKNCTGLPTEGQHTTARDTAIMTAAMLRHELYYKFSTVWLDEVDHGDGRRTQLTNTNKLIRLYDGCDGGKTGSTDEARYCVSATARRGDMRLIAVVLGAPSGSERFDTAAAMFDYGFANYENVTPQMPADAPETISVSHGTAGEIELVYSTPMRFLMPKNAAEPLTSTIELPQKLAAPVEQGTPLGTVQLSSGGEVLASFPISAAQGVDALSFRYCFGRLVDSLLLSQGDFVQNK